MVANGDKQDSAGGEANGHQICKLKNHSAVVSELHLLNHEKFLIQGETLC